MDKKTLRFFKYSVIGTIVICTGIFVCLVVFMSIQTDDLVTEISNTYMSEMSQQIQQKYQSIIDLRLLQMNGIIERTPPDTVSYGDSMLSELKLNAHVCDFSYLALYADENNIEVVCGDEVKMIDEEELRASLDWNGRVVTSSETVDGEKVLLMGIEAAYPMKDGGVSNLLIVGLPMEYLNQALFLSGDDSLVYFHIIEKDGNFVIRNAGAYRRSYFDRMRENFEEYNGKTPEMYVQELQEAMRAGKEYYTSVLFEGNVRQIYCAPIPENPEWYLICAMRSDFLTTTISELSTERIGVILAAVILILGAMAVLFVVYYHISQSHIVDLAKARKEAVRANMAKSDFLSSMSHDIRTPMNAIIGMTGIAQKNIGDTERVEDCLQKISLSSKHLLSLINDVLDVSKIESGKMVLNIAPTSLREIVDDLVNIVQPQVREKKQFFDVFIQDIVSEGVYCDSVRLSQILMNLLSNAVKFTPAEGRITVQVYQEELEKGNDYVRTHFTVADTGIGMSEEFQAKIWDTFTREENQVRHISGSGLGTAIAKKIIDLMGGTIELKSEQGKGSCFHVILDLQKADIQKNEQADDSNMNFIGRHILLAEDIDLNWEVAYEILSVTGMELERAVNGKECLEMFEKSEVGFYDAILMDVRMPEMDGYEATKAIRALERSDKDLPIIAMTADAFSDDAQRCLACGMNAHIAKPIDVKECMRILNKYLVNPENKEAGLSI